MLSRERSALVLIFIESPRRKKRWASKGGGVPRFPGSSKKEGKIGSAGGEKRGEAVDVRETVRLAW